MTLCYFVPMELTINFLCFLWLQAVVYDLGAHGPGELELLIKFLFLGINELKSCFTIAVLCDHKKILIAELEFLFLNLGCILLVFPT